MTYEIVRYQPGFRDQVLELQTHLWSPDLAVNDAYFAWKYEQNPYLDAPFLHLAVSGGRVVGMRGMYGASWQVGQPSGQFLAPCAGDLVVDPDHRDRGLAAAIIEAATHDLSERGYGYTFNLSASPATQLGSLRTGWCSTGPVEVARWRPGPGPIRARVRAAAGRFPPLAAAVRAARRPAEHRSRDCPAGQRDPFDDLDRHAAPGHRAASGPVSLEHAPRPAAMAELVERIGLDRRIRHLRDEAYFAWRFRNPLSRYRFLFWTGARLEGYLILRAAARGPDIAVSIVDWEATDARARGDLLRTAIRWGRFAELTIWSATLPPDAKRLLRQAGFTILSAAGSLGRAFRSGASRPVILVRRLGSLPLEEADWAIAGVQPADLDDWDLRMVYSDTF